MPHSKPNFNRMMQIIDEVFATRNDPDQLQVTPSQLEKLQQIHPSTLNELSDENGPLIWALMIPTTRAVMMDFIENRISEKQLLEHTPLHVSYDCIYLCSVSTLPEMRGKGKTKALCLDAIQAIRKDHPITTLFVWPFTSEGNMLAEALAKACGLELLKTERSHD